MNRPVVKKHEYRGWNLVFSANSGTWYAELAGDNVVLYFDQQQIKTLKDAKKKIDEIEDRLEREHFVSNQELRKIGDIAFRDQPRH